MNEIRVGSIAGIILIGD